MLHRYRIMKVNMQIMNVLQTYKPFQNNKQKLITRLLINSKLNVRLSVSHDERIKE